MKPILAETSLGKPQQRRRWRSDRAFPYLLIAPAILLFALFTLYPIIESLLLSFQVREEGQYVYAGLANYERLLQDPLFWTSLQNTFTILIIQVPMMLMIAMILASLLQSALVRMKAVYRIALFLPTVTALVASSIVFKTILDENNGIANYVLSWFGIAPVAWLADPFWAKAALILVITWRWVGYNMIIFIAGLQNIPRELYEASSLDGAGPIKQFFAITMPQMRPLILFAFVLSTIGTLQLFDESFILTKGGPDNATMTITLYLYQNGFKYFDFGYASAIAYVLVLLIGGLSYLQMKWAGDDK